MRLLIDGYNLLHATDLFGAGDLAGTLRGSREALLGFLAARLAEKERRATVIVFDARDAPPGLPTRYDYEEIDVRFARDYPDADAMIEAILESARATRDLTVVSGDRRVQRAARSSGARWAESSTWFAELCRRAATPAAAPAKPMGDVADNAAWIREFSDPEALARIERDAAATPPPAAAPIATPRRESPPSPDPKPAKRRRRRRGELAEPDNPKGEFGHGVFDPFPPGYGEDLLEE